MDYSASSRATKEDFLMMLPNTDFEMESSYARTSGVVYSANNSLYSLRGSYNYGASCLALSNSRSNSLYYSAKTSSTFTN